jgi:hypothetical protein
MKWILVGWLSGSWTQNVGIALADGPCDWWGITSAEGLHEWGRQAMHLLHYTLEFYLQLGKSAENLSHGRRIVKETIRCADLPVR